jgi:transcriptional regulator
MDEVRFVRGVVARLARTHESSEPKPWKMGDFSPEYIDGMLKAIVGIEVAITRMDGEGSGRTGHGHARSGQSVKMTHM